jgi:membrane protein YdbS with pleckstrin-like domain
MYPLLKRVLLSVLRVPEAPPEIPADGHSRVDVFRASPRYLTYQYLKLGLGLASSLTAVGVLAVVALFSGRTWGAALAVALGVFWIAKAFVLYAATRLAYEMRYYIVTDKSLRVRHGVLTVAEVTLTYVNVQNVSVEQGPLERFFGISNVVVETAGGRSGRHGDHPGSGSGHEGVLEGIGNAAEVRDLIRGCLARVHRQTGLGDPDEATAHSQPALGTAELPVLREILGEARALREQLRR